MFLIFLCVLCCLYLVYIQQRKYAHAHKLPPKYPGALPFIGHSHMLLLWSKDIYGFIENMAEFCTKWGGVTYGYFAGEIYYAIADPEDAITICNTALQKHYLYKFADDFIGQGLLTSSGPHYKNHRKLLLPAFGNPVISGFLDVFNNQSKLLVKLVDDSVGKGPFDPLISFRHVTLRTSCITVFGDKDEKDNEFLSTYIKIIDEIFIVLMERLQKVWLHNDYMFSLTKLKKKQDKLVKQLIEVSYEMINRKRMDFKNRADIENLLESGKCHQSFIDIILKIAEDGKFNDLEIKDELTTAVVASYETTSQQLTLIASFIGTYPKIQEKMYQEIMEVVGDRDVEKYDIPRLVYVDAVIKECLRLVPVVPLLARYVDTDIKLKNYTLRAGTYVLCIPQALHRNKAYWGPDADEFRPERWLQEDMGSKLAGYNFAFSAGKRSCVGRRYAMVSIKVALVHLVRNFRWKSDHTKVKFKIDIVTRSVSGHEIIVEKRETRKKEERDENNNIIS